HLGRHRSLQRREPQPVAPVALQEKVHRAIAEAAHTIVEEDVVRPGRHGVGESFGLSVWGASLFFCAAAFMAARISGCSSRNAWRLSRVISTTYVRSCFIWDWQPRREVAWTSKALSMMSSSRSL